METSQTSLVPAEVTPGSKSSSSLIQIDSIYIDLKFPNKTEVMSCSQHNFSMRGYVSEVRTKNPSATIPFQSNGPLNDSDEQLPPMHVQRFRWWRCAECRGLISSATEQNGTTSNCCTQALLPRSTSLCISSHVDTTMLLPTETQEGPILENNGSIKDVDVNNSPNMDVPCGSLPLSDHQRTKNAGNGELDPHGIIKNSENWDLVSIDGENKLHEPACQEVGNIREEDAVNQVGHVLETNKKEGEHDQEVNGEVESLRDGNLAQVHELERSDSPERTGDRPFPYTSSRNNSQRRDGSSGSRRKNPKSRLLTDLLSDEVKTKKKRVKGPAPAAGKRSLSKEDLQKSVSGFHTPPSASEIKLASGTSLQIGSKADRKCKAERVSEQKTEAVGKRKTKLNKVHGEFSAIQDQEEHTGKTNSKNGDLLLDPFKAAKNSVFQTQTEKGKSIADSPLAVAQISKSIAPSNEGSSNLGLDLSLSCLLNLNVSSAEVTKCTNTNNHLNKTSLYSEQLGAMCPAEPDQPWKKRRAWDLNAREAPNSSSVLEKEPFPLLKEMDFLQLHRRENDFEVEGCLGGSNRGSDKIRGKGLQQGSSDDIQEIVELMARNQFERGLGGGVRRLPEVHGFGMAKQQTKLIPGTSRFSPFNASRGSRSNFSHIDRNPMKMGTVQDNQLNIFNIFSDKVILTGEKQLSANASVRPEDFPFEFVVPQKSANLPMEVEHKGKTISDLRADELNKAREARVLWPKLGNYEFNHVRKRHLDPYTNDSIPAMQLLSLMDGSSPGTSFNVGRSRIIDRPSSPCGYHPSYHSDAREDLINGSLFFHQNRGNELPGLGTGLYTAKGSSGQPSISLSRQSPFRVPERKEREKTHVPWSTNAGQSSKLGRSTGNPQRHDFSRRHGNLEIRTRQDVGPVRITMPNEVCTINRNPADFSIPEEGNVFTICGTELKFPKRKYSRGRPRSLDNGAPKRPRVAKNKVGEEHVQYYLA